jgi:hypothetical protein
MWITSTYNYKEMVFIQVLYKWYNEMKLVTVENIVAFIKKGTLHSLIKFFKFHHILHLKQ